MVANEVAANAIVPVALDFAEGAEVFKAGDGDTILTEPTHGPAFVAGPPSAPVFEMAEMMDVAAAETLAASMAVGEPIRRFQLWSAGDPLFGPADLA